MTHNTFILWDSGNHEEVAARIAVVGDYLPAGNLSFPAGAGWREMASNVAEYFGDISTTFANLECPICSGMDPPRPLNGIGQIVCGCESSLEYLQAIRVKAIGIANNHIYDFADPGLQQTTMAIRGRTMVSLGAGRTTRDPPEVFVFHGPANLRVGFWAAAKATHDAASGDLAGVEPATPARAMDALREMKKRGATFCVALLHVGCLRTNRPDPDDVQLVDSLAKLGFGLVACSHSHRLAGFRRVNRPEKPPSFCFYGIGSLISGYVSASHEREGLIVVAGFNCEGKFVRLEIRPVVLDETGFGMIPGASESSRILDRFRQLSTEIANGSYKELFYRDVSRGLLHLYLRDIRAAFRSNGMRGLATKMSRIRPRHMRRLVHKIIG